MTFWQLCILIAVSVVLGLPLFLFTFYCCVKLGTYGYLRGKQIFEKDNGPAKPEFRSYD